MCCLLCFVCLFCVFVTDRCSLRVVGWHLFVFDVCSLLIVARVPFVVWSLSICLCWLRIVVWCVVCNVGCLSCAVFLCVVCVLLLFDVWCLVFVR